MKKLKGKIRFSLLHPITLLSITVIITVITCGCNGNKRKCNCGCMSGSIGMKNDTVAFVAEENPHADFDIAMTIRSIVDAINMEEKIDSASYSYIGVLTDGSGKPLYTDTEGAPGEWEVEVASTSTVNIKNIRPGDLLSEELCHYITQSLNPDSLTLITDRVYRNAGTTTPTNVKIYNFRRGTIHFETRMEQTTSGEESPVLSIRISGDDLPL